MKQFWALPTFLRLAIASHHHAFSIQNDLLAFPQYEVVFPSSFVTEAFAQSRLAFAASSATDPAESKETQELSRSGSHSSTDSPEGGSEGGSLERTYESLILDDQRYLCSIPLVATPDQNSTDGASQRSADEEEKELMRATDRGWELLQGMQGSCIYFPSGWWSYSFCYNGEVKQFHQLPPSKGVPIYPPVEDLNVQSYILGKFPNSKKKKKEANAREGMVKGLARLETKGEMRYLVQILSGGTTCDLTGKERKIEVQFHCYQGSGDRIGMIKEVSTCSYLMIIYTPRLCHDVAFLPPQEDKPNSITCQPIIADSDVAAWTNSQGESPLEDVIIPLSGEQRPVIGGIEVGAKKLVGTEGKVIEKSVVAGGGKETLVGTVANSRGGGMNPAEIKKYKIDPKDVEKLKKDVAKLAVDKPWRLDLVDTPRGREYRGVIEQEKGDDGDLKNEEAAKAGQIEQGERANSNKRKEDENAEGSEEVYKEEL